MSFLSIGRKSIIPVGQTLVCVALMSTTTLAAGAPSSSGSHSVSAGLGASVGSKGVTAGVGASVGGLSAGLGASVGGSKSTA